MAKDLVGNQFGKLIVIGKADIKSRRAYWVCKCECGTVKNVRGDNLLSGRTVSCGCYHREVKTTHGDSNSRLYGIWQCMRHRCQTPTHKQYPEYGGRGITVCPEWDDYDTFKKWAMDAGYDVCAKRGDCTIDRIDNDKGYSPDNCRWANGVTQSRNKRNNRVITFNGQTHTLTEWAERIGMDANTLHARITYLGWSIARALTTPTMTQFSRR